MRFLNGTSVSLLLLALVAAAPIACGGSDKPVQTGPTPTASSTPPVGVAPPPAADAGAPANPLAAILTTDPAQLAALFAAAQAAIPALIQPPAAGDPIEAGIKALAAKHAPGMQPVGGISRGDLTENGPHVSMMVTLEPGKCYAVIGFSPKDGVKDLDLRMLAPPLYNFITGEDVTDDNSPVIGKAPTAMCPVIPIGLPYKVDISSQKGAGKAGVQLYAKAK